MTKQQLKKYIKTRLGEPFVTVELADEQLNIIIDDTIQKFTDNHYNGSMEDVVYLTTTIGQRDYTLPDTVQSVMAIFNEKNLFISDEALLMRPLLAESNVIGYDTLQMNFQEIEVMRHLYKQTDASFKQDIRFDYNSSIKKLRLIASPKKVERLAVYCMTSEIDPTPYYNDGWTKDYCVALSKIMWATNLGKYSGGNLLNNVTINYDSILNEGKAERDALLEDLRLKFADPPDLQIG
jgi:hypothetical protein